MTSQPLIREDVAEPFVPQPRLSNGLQAVPRQRSRQSQRFGFDVAVVGLGYVGLPTALAFHEAGLRVLGLDVSDSRINDICRGSVDVGAEDRSRLTRAVQSNDLVLDTTSAYLHDAASVIICVPTPVDEYLLPDLEALRGACQTVVNNAVPGQTLILTSTTYVGSTRDLLADPLRKRGMQPGSDIFVAFSPERIDPGNDRHAHEDVPRVVGGVTAACAERAVSCLSGYARLIHVVSSAETAELTKLHENTFRAVNIAYANEMSLAAHTLGVDITEVIAAAATKPYGFMPFLPGPGVGGHCIPCDPHYLLWQLRPTRQRLPLIEQAMTAIAERPLHVVDRVREALGQFGSVLSGSTVLIMGVAYKPDVQDVRESPALVIINALLAADVDVKYYDPYVPVITLDDGQLLRSLVNPTDEAPDVVLLHTAHTNVALDWLPRRTLLLNATYRPVETEADQMLL